jgi:hypothetical protein
MPAPSSTSSADSNSILFWPAIAALVLNMTGCSSSDGDGGGAADEVVLSGGQQSAFDGQGFFRAGNVAGLAFVSGAQAGVTDAKGAFSCDADERISFSIGAVALGDTACGPVAHAAALTVSGSLTDPAAINIMRFLMVLDQDENPDNGIAISDPVRVIADNWAQIDFLAADFESELSQVISDIASIEGRIASVPDAAAALVFLDASLSCAYSGVFYDWFPGNGGSVPISLSLSIFREAVSGVDLGELVMISQDPILPLSLESTGEVELGTFPGISHFDFSAQFITSDMLKGTWSNAQTVQATDRSGRFEAFRLGESDGEYRFVGKVERDNLFVPGRQLLSRFEVTLSGDTLSGRAFDLLLGASLSITGRRIADSNDFEITVSRLGTATVTLMLDADGEPVGLTGGWPQFEGNVIKSVGCRLT